MLAGRRRPSSVVLQQESTTWIIRNFGTSLPPFIRRLVFTWNARCCKAHHILSSYGHLRSYVLELRMSSPIGVIKPDFRLMFDLVSFMHPSTRKESMIEWMTTCSQNSQDPRMSRSSHHIRHRSTSKAVASDLLFVLRLTYSTPNQQGISSGFSTGSRCSSYIVELQLQVPPEV